jgi:protein-disulfide isomerase
MNIKRIIFWAWFIIILGLIVWGLSIAMNKPGSGSTLGTPSPVAADDHVLGAKNAPVTLIEYGDFQCPACARYFPFIERLTKEASTTVKLVFRHFPLYPLPHPNSYISAEAAEAAALQGKFWEMYRLLYENQNDWAELSDPHQVMYSYAEKLNLDMVKFKADIDSASVKARVSRDADEAQRLGIGGTPTFFVNGKAIETPSTYDSLKALIEAAASGSSK